jgi:hypothetical protein
MMTARCYFDEIVIPTVAEFKRDNCSIRKAMLASTMLLHTLDYIFQNRAESPKIGDEQLKAVDFH